MSTAPDADPTPDRPAGDGYTGLPAWVKWTLIAILAVIVLLVLAQLVVGGDHGPGRHVSAPSPSAAVPAPFGP